MRILWAHDHIFYEGEGSKVYSPGKLPYSTWRRYLKIFSDLHIVARSEILTGESIISDYVISSGPNVKYTFLPSFNTVPSFFLSRKRALYKLQELIRTKDAIIARLPSFNGELAIKAAQKVGKPYAVEMVACDWDGFWHYGNLKGKIMAPRGYYVTKKLVRKAPFVVYVTKAFLQNRYPNLNHNIGISNVNLPPTDLALYAERKTRKFQIKSAKIGLIGSLDTKIKGVLVAVKAMRILVKTIPKLKLEIVGAGNNKRFLDIVKNYGLRKNITFLGVLSPINSVLEWLDKIDLYIQPSYTEGMSRALIEAMSRACPAAGSRAGGIPELLNPEYLHKPGDHKKLAHDILKILSNRKLYNQLAKDNFQLSKSYTSEVLDKKRDSFWQNFHNYVKNNKV